MPHSHTVGMGRGGGGGSSSSWEKPQRHENLGGGAAADVFLVAGSLRQRYHCLTHILLRARGGGEEQEQMYCLRGQFANSPEEPGTAGSLQQTRDDVPSPIMMPHM
jgi:hypothetical protein